MSLSAQMQELLDRLKRSGKRTGLFLSTTANRNNPPFYFSTVREDEFVCAGSAIFGGAGAIQDVVAFFDGKVDVFFLDTEVKNVCDSLEADVRRIAQKTTIMTYKPNDLTIDSLDTFASHLINDFRGKRVTVVGAGNLGSKAALRFAEKSAHVTLVGRKLADLATIVAGINLIKRGHGQVVGSISLEESLDSTDLLIGCTPGTAAIDSALAPRIPVSATIIDVGNGLFEIGAAQTLGKRGAKIYCLSSEAGVQGFFRNWLFQEKQVRALGRHDQADGLALITPGLLGLRGDVLVDNPRSPQKVYGVCDGAGGILAAAEAAPFLERMKNGQRK